MEDFSAWFSGGGFGGFACCMLAIATNALYTTLRRRGTTRQLAGAIIVCVMCALLLLPAIVWYTTRFTAEQSNLSIAEVQVVLAYIALCGWFLPLSVTASYCLFTPMRLSTTSTSVPLQKRTTRLNPATALRPPRRQAGVSIPFVFNEETPWGWLEYRNGSFQGQRLALKRAIIALGRDEDNDIWIDDDMASRHHAEIAWNEGDVCLTDCDSMNGVILNGKRIVGSVALETEGMLEIGACRFTFSLAEKQEPMLESFDPLNNHTWRSTLDSLTGRSHALPTTSSFQHEEAIEKIPTTTLGEVVASVSEAMLNEWQETAALQKVTPLPMPPEQYSAILIQSGELAGKTVVLDRPAITLGRGSECNIIMNDASISRRHVQFSHLVGGDYVQDLASRNGTVVNGEPLLQPHLLQAGDRIRMGAILLEYVATQEERVTPLPHIVVPQSFTRLTSGPVPLKLPSRQKENS